MLYDYAENERAAILDLLFKPKYGASVQMLKIEVRAHAAVPRKLQVAQHGPTQSSVCVRAPPSGLIPSDTAKKCRTRAGNHWPPPCWRCPQIGGDDQSTDGTEPSHMHRKGQQPECSAGYEWFLAKEAKARNARMRIYALPW